MDVRKWRWCSSGNPISSDVIHTRTDLEFVQDFHLAKRHYDMALETNAEAYLPVTISLIKLYARSIWHTLMGGKNGLDLWNFEDQTSESRFSCHNDPDIHCVSAQGNTRQWNGGGPQIDDGRQPDGSKVDSVEDKGVLDDPEDDSPWYLGKAREEYKRKLGQDTKRVQEDEDPIQVSFLSFNLVHHTLTATLW